MHERYAHVLLEYEPTYTSFLQQRKKKKRLSSKGKSVEPVEVSSDSEIDLHRVGLQEMVGKIKEPLEEEFVEEEENMGEGLDDLPSLLNKKKKSKKTTAPPTMTTKRAPLTGDATASAEQKKQRVQLGSDAGEGPG